MLLLPRFLCLLLGTALVILLLWRLPPTITRSSPAFFPSDSPFPVPSPSTIDWSRFAYVQYATNTAYLCNSAMIFERLHRLGSRPDRVLLYPSHRDFEGDEEGGLLRKMQTEYRVRLVPVDVQRRSSSSDATWAESYTKLLAFNQTRYARVLSVDSDGTILQTMDELFLLPPTPVAMPRAYWLDGDVAHHHRPLTSALVLLQPSGPAFTLIWDRIHTATASEYDMEILNALYRDSALVLPHRPYLLLTGEFRAHSHDQYLGGAAAAAGAGAQWDPEAVLAEAKFLHFSDWPVAKPWLKTPDAVLEKEQPACRITVNNSDHSTGRQDCRERELWRGFYRDFAARRQRICGLNVE